MTVETNNKSAAPASKGLFGNMLRKGNRGKQQASSDDGLQETIQTLASMSTSDDSSCSSFSTTVSKLEKEMIEIVGQYFSLMNEHKLKEMKTLCTSDCYVNYPDCEMTHIDYLKDIRSIIASFPDFSVEWKRSTVAGPKKIRIDFVQAKGTHTGKPFSCGSFPPIGAMRIKCKNDHEQMIIEFRNDKKIKSIVVIPSSTMTGPEGFYEQIGGMMF